MLDRATLDRLAKTPEANAPMVNVALAEEGSADVLLALATSAAVGPEALAVIALRIEAEGDLVGRTADEAEPLASVVEALDRRLVVHRNTPGHERDQVLARHADEAFFVLAAATHARATDAAIERAARWPAASAAHDRLWIPLLDPARIAPLTLEAWATDGDAHLRETVARVARDSALLEPLSADAARRVRRAVASNMHASGLRARLAASDVAPEVRARAEAPLSAHEVETETVSVDSARFAAALRAMEQGGVLSPDVTRAFSSDFGALDDEGAKLAAEVLARAEVAGLFDKLGGSDPRSSRVASFAAGLALRAPTLGAGDASDAETRELADLVYDASKALARLPTSSPLASKARVAAWLADGLSRVPFDVDELVRALASSPLASDRMVLARAASTRPDLVRSLADKGRHAAVVPGALLELAWADLQVDDATVLDLASRVQKPRKRAEDLPEDEIDLDPSLRSLAVLERVVLAVVLRANVTPRAALPVTGLDSRRVRYVLSAMPQWKGRLSGGKLARVLRQHAGALEAAHAEGRTRSAKVEPWTERLMHEIEVAVALAVGHLTGAEVASRVGSGRQAVSDGLTLAEGAEARAALEGPGAVAPLLAWASRTRTQSAPALAVWLLLERFDRERSSALVASAIDGVASADALQGKAVVHPSVVDAIALLERRKPGRLETIHPQSPKGRAAVGSALARAYRGLGGMRDERTDA